jgi:hypothetical protein
MQNGQIVQSFERDEKMYSISIDVNLVTEVRYGMGVWINRAYLA